MSAPQSFSHHMRFNPPFHFVLMPILALNVIFSVYATVERWPADRLIDLWWIVMSVAFIMIAILGRRHALKVQDRVIRLEERLRLASLLPANELPHIGEFTTRQLIGLRFASDAELPALARRTLTQNLELNAIKQSIVNWRPDNERV